jgi:hypothetical protein
MHVDYWFTHLNDEYFTISVCITTKQQPARKLPIRVCCAGYCCTLITHWLLEQEPL